MSQEFSNRIGGVSFSLKPNVAQWDGDNYTPKSLSAVFLAFLDTSNGGAFRIPQLLDKTCKVVSLIKPDCSLVKSVGDVFNKTWTGIAITRVPSSIINCKESIKTFLGGTKQIPGASVRNFINMVEDSASLVSTVGHSFGPFLKMAEKTEGAAKTLFKAAGVSAVVADGCDLVKNSQDAYLANAYLKKVELLTDVSPELKQALQDTKKAHILKIMKSVCSVAGFVLGLSMVSGGLAVMSGFAVMTAAVSLMGTVFATTANLHEDSMKYKRVQFYSPKSVAFDLV